MSESGARAVAARCAARISDADKRREVEKEILDHLLAMAESLQARGMTPEAALAAAVQEFGDPEQLSRLLGRQNEPALQADLKLGLLVGCVVGVLATASQFRHEMDALFGWSYYESWDRIARFLVQNHVLPLIRLLMLAACAGLALGLWRARRQTPLPDAVRGATVGVFLAALKLLWLLPELWTLGIPLSALSVLLTGFSLFAAVGAGAGLAQSVWKHRHRLTVR